MHPTPQIGSRLMKLRYWNVDVVYNTEEKELSF